MYIATYIILAILLNIYNKKGFRYSIDVALIFRGAHMFDKLEERVKIPGSGVFMPRTSGVLY
jgi:hypothetical protein